MRTVWIGLVTIALVLGTLVIAERLRPPETRPAVGYLAPDFTLPSLDGEPVRLSDFRGKAVFLNFWATWCAPCRREMPDIQAVARARSGAVQVILIEVAELNWDAARPFLRDLGIELLVVQDRESRVLEAYQVRALPTSFVLDRRGIIRAVRLGEMSRDEMEAAIDRALEGR